ncbi:Thiol-disulfide isomerase or thioredoxin [Halanaeroarchaeum sp. HSR-CO]|nr:Thiol-disulfide isomerase or thioredoxin [Halanaeroarchaeum sp. HSR-CO]
MLTGGFVAVLLVLAIGTSMTMLSGEADRHGGIDWESDVDAALTEANETETPLLLYVWMDDCGACEDFGARLAEDRPAALDAYVLAETDLGSESTAEQYGVSATPTLVVIAPDGTKVTTINPVAVDDLDERLDRAHENASDP